MINGRSYIVITNLNRVGILGGTFDPIHTGHLIIAEMARQDHSLDKVLFIPAGHPPHKMKTSITPAKDRLKMVQLATESNPYFIVDDIEIKKDKISYTVDTLRDLKLSYPSNTEFSFIIGADSLVELKGWKDPQQILDLCKILVYVRNGVDKAIVQSEISKLEKDFGAQVDIVEGPAIDISSSLIREMIRKGVSARYIIPKVVEEYISKVSLYTENFDE